jgi:putative ATPase
MYYDYSMEPLASKIRPRTIEEFVGQEHVIGPGKPLHIAIEKKHLFSFIFWGPPGVGKTTLARMYARSLNAELHELSAVSAGKDDIRKIVDAPKGLYDQPKVLFLDEIHRFNKSQQDFLLPHVESGALTLIGATTENPSFEVIPALLSRCRIFILKELKPDEMKQIIKRSGIDIDDTAIDWLVRFADGDARQALSSLEAATSLYTTVTVDTLKEALQSKTLRYDKKGEEHYNTISAFIKSLRASQPDAALYYLARMVKSGEDPKFIARRMVIFASEDIGLAQPTALVVANAVFRAVETVGMPEAAISLGHGAAYLAECKKDRRAYDGIMAALADAEELGNLPIPLKVRNAPTKLMKDIGYGKEYEMYDTDDYLPEELKGKKYLQS